jgi:sugar/nucleoside kinase (ribokinase family)
MMGDPGAIALSGVTSIWLNQAVAVARLGARAALIAAVGQDREGTDVLASAVHRPQSLSRRGNHVRGSSRNPMKAVLLHEHDGLRTFAVVLSRGEEAMTALPATAVRRPLSRHARRREPMLT